MFIIKKLFLSLLLVTIVGGMLILNAKEKKDAVVKFGKVYFTGDKLNAANQSKFNKYFNTIKSYEQKYKKVKLRLVGDISCRAEDEEYAENIEDMLIDRGLNPKQISVEYLRAKNGYANCSEKKTVILTLKAKKLRPIPPKVKKPTLQTIVVLLQGRKFGTAIEVSTPSATVVIDKPNEFVAITNDKNISQPKEANTQELVSLFGASLHASKIKRYHFVLYFNHLHLDKKSQVKMKEILADIKKSKNPFIKIIGHTDTLLSVKENYKVGLERAKYVANLIKKSDVKYLKMDVTSYSELDLAVQTPDNTKELLNRRVELFIQ
jgi:outer membrane protein OmpA-like peptidoglycan-associated protein